MAIPVLEGAQGSLKELRRLLENRAKDKKKNLAEANVKT